jgi:hypothetical protein
LIRGANDWLTFFPQKKPQKDIERCQREDAMYETAKQLVDIAIEAHAQKFGIDRETAEYWVCSAAELRNC